MRAYLGGAIPTLTQPLMRHEPYNGREPKISQTSNLNLNKILVDVRQERSRAVSAISDDPVDAKTNDM